MAFNPSNYKPPVCKKLPVVLLLDVSGSMSGEKIDNLYDATIEMINTFVAEKVKETIIDVAIITFGDQIKLHTPFTPVSDLQNAGVNRFVASGMTPLGTALKMAKDMIDDKTVLPSPIYTPAVVVVSDGQPNDEWMAPLKDFLTKGRSQKCQRFAIAIGNDADKDMLEKFTGAKDMVFYAERAADIASCFHKFTMSVSTRSRSENPNVVPTPNGATFDNNTAQDSDDEDEYI
jgi:uncharacterized protein YegL